MTVKRSRLCRSASSSSSAVMTDNISPSIVSSPFFSRKDNNIVFSKPDNKERKPGIFSVASPVHESSDLNIDCVSRRMCGFLDNCCYCRKIIPKDRDIFMYSYLQAFCSEGCRERQINIDEKLQTRPVKPRVKRLVT